MKLCTQGLNYGTYTLADDHFCLSSQSDQKILQFAYSDISVSNASGKNEVAIEFNAARKGDVLTEIRFYVQNNEMGSNVMKKKRLHLLSALMIRWLRRLGDQKGNIICSFEELPMMIPRGKYTLDMYDTYAKFHGRTYDYKILYSDIKKVFQLPRVDLLQMAIVIQLEKPLKQGQTLHHFIIIQVDKDIEQKIKVNLTPEQLKERELEAEVEGPLYHVLATLFKNIVDIERIIIPGDFKSAKDDTKDLENQMINQSVKCSVKAQDGFLYPLKSSLIFIHKPVIYLKHSSIKYIEFSRINSNSMGIGGSNRTFDLNIILLGDCPEAQFLNLDQVELKVLMKYFKAAGIKMREVDVESKRGHDIDEYEEGGPQNRRRAVVGQNEEEEYDEEEEDAEFEGKEKSEDEEEEGESDQSDDVDAEVDKEELNELRGNKQVSKKRKGK